MNDVITAYLAERQKIYNNLLDATSNNITNYQTLKDSTPRLEEICTAYFKDKPIPDELPVKEVFRFFCMIWKDDKLFRRNNEPQTTTNDTESV